ncbi:short-chain dehydrogenase/reductase SDR [Rhodopirellula europaea SH398]|uniref:Short-chain dehydrogenase/reductase SDR n=1 Tax=Rhodopirellula europaea SH398 TaxID=1263868 RepID=M5RZN9_9BACT|nr:short-chain dehydrogenase/reductase SDR [Rhodopirellula europaea SH398]
MIVGGLGWLGSEHTRRCHQAGLKLVVLDYFDKSAFDDRLGDAADAIEYHQFDGYDHEGFADVLEQVFQAHGHIDGIVNNAFDFSQRTGFTPDRDDFLKSTIADWQNTFDCGMVWPMLATQRFLRQDDLGDARVINIASMYAVVAPCPDAYEGTAAFMLPQYGMAKAAMINFTKFIASYYGKQGVRCNAIVPGAFPKPENISETFLKNLTDRIPLGEIGVPSDLSGVLTFLLSEDSRYITGQTIVADGGWTIR